MFLCFETIKVENGELLNIIYHQKRVDNTRKNLFGFHDKFDLEKLIKDIPKAGLYRLRVDYRKCIESMSYKRYKQRNINSFKIVHSKLSYKYKYANRDEINKLLEKNYDDIIIIKDGLITDTSIANIAISLNGIWFTPKKPLLYGTMREQLLGNNFLKCANLSLKELEKADNFAIMNSLIGFKTIKDKKISNFI